MVKLVNPDWSDAPALKAMADLIPGASGFFARMAQHAQGMSHEKWQQAQADCRFAADYWSKMAPWKQVRWMKCEQKTIGKAAGNGFSLFLYCWQVQRITSKMAAGTTPYPISPCARRKTDPNASPWDYTP